MWCGEAGEYLILDHGAWYRQGQIIMRSSTSSINLHCEKLHMLRTCIGMTCVMIAFAAYMYSHYHSCVERKQSCVLVMPRLPSIIGDGYVN
jgi:hypothetical protein